VSAQVPVKGGEGWRFCSALPSKSQKPASKQTSSTQLSQSDFCCTSMVVQQLTPYKVQGVCATYLQGSCCSRESRIAASCVVV